MDRGIHTSMEPLSPQSTIQEIQAGSPSGSIKGLSPTASIKGLTLEKLKLDDSNQRPRSAREQMNQETRQERLEKTRSSQKIDQLIKEEQRLHTKPDFELILLGPSQSGKSTVLKQFRLLCGQSFSNEERRTYQKYIQQFMVTNIQKVIYSIEKNSLQYQNDDQKAAAESLKTLDIERDEFDQDDASDLVNLWKSDVVQMSLLKGVAGFEETSKTFLDRAPEAFQDTYIPTDNDILLCRKVTSSISKTSCNFQNRLFDFYDVAGQKDKRSRWAPYFEKTLTSIIFVVSTACFCDTMHEDSAMNQMHDTLSLFETLRKTPLLQNRPFIVLFNKVDLLNDKLKEHRVVSCFPGFKGKNTKNDYLAFLKEKFLSFNKPGTGTISILETNATDCKLMSKILSTIMLNILRETLDL